MLLGDRPRILIRSTGYDPQRFEEALRSAAPFVERLNLERSVSELTALMAEIKAPERELYIVSDGQATTWGNLSDKAREGFADLRRPGVPGAAACFSWPSTVPAARMSP